MSHPDHRERPLDSLSPQKAFAALAGHLYCEAPELFTSLVDVGRADKAVDLDRIALALSAFSGRHRRRGPGWHEITVRRALRMLGRLVAPDADPETAIRRVAWQRGDQPWTFEPARFRSALEERLRKVRAGVQVAEVITQLADQFVQACQNARAKNRVARKPSRPAAPTTLSPRSRDSASAPIRWALPLLTMDSSTSGGGMDARDLLVRNVSDPEGEQPDAGTIRKPYGGAVGRFRRSNHH